MLYVDIFTYAISLAHTFSVPLTLTLRVECWRLPPPADSVVLVDWHNQYHAHTTRCREAVSESVIV
jgi:hypothetical protein